MKRFITIIRRTLITAICICITLYFCVTSSFVLKSVLQPLLSFLFEFPVTVEYVTYSPFTSELHVKNVKLGFKNEPFVVGKEGTCKIDNLFGLIFGHIKFSDVKLSDTSFRAVRSSDGKWNFPWMAEDYGSSDLTEPLVVLDFSNIKINNGRFLLEIKRKKPHMNSKLLFHSLNIKCPLFANNKQADITYKGKININGRNVDLSSGDIRGNISSYFNEWTIPESIFSDFNLQNPVGEINNSSVKNNSVTLSTNIYSEGKIYRIESFKFKEKHNDTVKTDLTISGDYNAAYSTGAVRVIANPISPVILSLVFSTFTKYSFGKMKLYYVGNMIFSNLNVFNMGKLIVNDFEINKNENSDKIETVPYDISLDYSLNYNYTNRILTLDRLDSFFTKNLVNQQDKFRRKIGKKALTLGITKPINVSFRNKSWGQLVGEKSHGFITLDNLDIRFLNSLLVNLPDIELLSGVTNGKFAFEINPEKNDIDFKGSLKTDEFAFKLGSYSPKNIQVNEKFICTLHGFKNLEINPFSFRLNDQKENVLSSVIRGNLDFLKETAKITVFTPLLNDGIIEYFPDYLRNNKVFKGIINQVKPFNFDTKFTFTLNSGKRKGTIGDARIKLGTEKYKDAVLELNNYIPFSWDSKKFKMDKNINTEIKISDLNTVLLNVFMPENSSFYFTKGTLNTSFKCLIAREISNIKIDGKLNMPKLAVKINKRNIDDIDINSIYKLNYDSEKNKFTFQKTNVVFDVNRENALSFEAFGIFEPYKDKFLLGSNIISLNRQLFNLFPNITSSNITRLRGAGKLFLNHLKKTTEINTDLIFKEMHYISPETEEEVIPFDEGNIIFGCLIKNKILKIKQADFNFNMAGKKLLNLELTGNIPHQIKNNKTVLNLFSSGIHFDFIKQMVEAFSKKKKPVEKHAIKKSKPLSSAVKNEAFEGIDFMSNIHLNNVYYNAFTTGQIDSTVSLKNSELEFNPIAVKIDNSNIDGNILFNLKFKNVYPYSIKLHSNELPIQTLLGIFDISDNSVVGNLEIADINLVGIDKPFAKSKYKKLIGFVKLDANDITLPLTLTQYKLFKIMFIPLEVLARLRNLIPAGVAPQSIMHSLSSTSKIFTSLETVHLDKAEIEIKAENDIELKKVIFTGGEDDLINYMKFSGLFTLNKELNVKAYSDISGLKFPLEIYGTFDDPKTNYSSFAYHFMKDNAINILNPMNLFYFAVDVGKGVTNTITGTVKFIASPLIGSGEKVKTEE